jgi:small subunit ribosomal protein S25e
MGGAKKKSPAQQEKSQKEETGKKSGDKKKSKKGSKPEGESKKAVISVIVNDEHAMKFIKSAKVVTVQELSRQMGVKISAANAYLLKLMQNGSVKRVGGQSGHHIYQPVSA